ncbi:cell division protein FtsZ [Paenibacillus cremeus]|uniref:Cell division protein FtsZ n=1 Tax=Paenibacillus cremeus TaxID=2163881 RepID=A0A559K5D2_9BACL|nr:cell division protein FtsZ [Paenibacillus cremeus]TVY07310.1 cell division protein FtsZ [Paenibacillus cremeus]
MQKNYPVEYDLNIDAIIELIRCNNCFNSQLMSVRKAVVHILSREQILSILNKNLGNGLWALLVLKKENRALNKELLGDIVNQHYDKQKGVKLLGSRHMLDEMAARLEGAGLVEVSEVGRARLYKLSDLGEELIDFIQVQKSKN